MLRLLSKKTHRRSFFWSLLTFWYFFATFSKYFLLSLNILNVVTCTCWCNQCRKTCARLQFYTSLTALMQVHSVHSVHCLPWCNRDFVWQNSMNPRTIQCKPLQDVVKLCQKIIFHFHFMNLFAISADFFFFAGADFSADRSCQCLSWNLKREPETFAGVCFRSLHMWYVMCILCHVQLPLWSLHFSVNILWSLQIIFMQCMQESLSAENLEIRDPFLRKTHHSPAFCVKQNAKQWETMDLLSPKSNSWFKIWI